MQPRSWAIATAVGVAAVAAAGAHYIALSCCFTRLSILGLLGYGLLNGYWFDWVLVSVLSLSAAVAFTTLGFARMGPSTLAAFTRFADVLMSTGLGIAILVPIILWSFVFAPGVDRYSGGIWTYETIQSPLVETLMDITIGSLVFALASWSKLKVARRRCATQ